MLELHEAVHQLTYCMKKPDKNCLETMAFETSLFRKETTTPMNPVISYRHQMSYYCFKCKDDHFLFANKCYSKSDACINGSHPYSYDRADDYVGCLAKPIFIY